MTRVFSGIKPTGPVQLGNLLGALRHWVTDQDEADTIFCVVDLHALTVPQDPAELRTRTLELAQLLLAIGIDPARSTLFVQSHVREHVELSWLMECTASFGELRRMTQFKDKAGKNSENVSLGLFAYPSLMAADILAYKATHVPVGEDQKQHLELCRDIAIKFNNDYKVDFFPVVEPVIEGAATRVMSLRDGTAKMSKSDPSDQSRINLTDDADTISKKIRKAKTDMDPLPDHIDGLKDRPEAKNLVNIYAALAGHTPAQVIADYAGAQFGTFKPALADLAVAKLAPITTEMNRLMKDPAEIDRILGAGAVRADALARPVLEQVYDIIGMIRSRPV